MEVWVWFLLSFVALFCHHFAHSATLVVDGVSEWKNPMVQVGDSIIFRHKYKYNLYIFKNRRAFNMCNFTEATLLTGSNSTFTWHPSRLGSFYFAFKNGSTGACDDGHKLAVQVSSSMSPEYSASPPTRAPIGGDVVSASPSPGVLSSSPAYPWPNRPEETLSSPSPSPMTAIYPGSGGPGGDRRQGGGSVPFINSNPAVPLPTGEVDSATIHPVPSSSDSKLQLVGWLKALCCVAFLL